MKMKLRKSMFCKTRSDREETFWQGVALSPLLKSAKQTNKQTGGVGGVDGETECNHWPLFKEAI